MNKLWSLFTYFYYTIFRRFSQGKIADNCLDQPGNYLYNFTCYP